MSVQPIQDPLSDPNIYGFQLNQANNFVHKAQLVPPIIGYSAVKVLSSISDCILSLNILRPGYLLNSTDPNPQSIQGIVRPGDPKQLYEINSNYISYIEASVYQQSVPSFDNIDVVLQFYK